MNLNVAIVDDHPLVLEGLKSLLLQTEGIDTYLYCPNRFTTGQFDCPAFNSSVYHRFGPT